MWSRGCARASNGIAENRGTSSYATAFPDLIRTGDGQGLLQRDWPLWRRFRDMRARTSHTYSAAVAQQVVAGIPDFLAEATHLLDQLQQRLR